MVLKEIMRDGAAVIVDASLPSTLDVSFFVPCYNEEQRVLGTVDKLVRVSAELRLAFEILVFDDCSTDRTVEVVHEYKRANPTIPLRLFVNSTNRGIARNFIEGAFLGNGKYYRVVCGDDVEPFDTLRKILARAGDADIIIPYHTSVIGRPLHRRLISRLYTTLVNLASGRSLNYYNGLPLYRRRDVVRFHVEATGLGYQAEFLLRLLQEGRSYVQIPLVATDTEGSSALNMRNFISVGFSIFKIMVGRVRALLYG